LGFKSLRSTSKTQENSFIIHDPAMGKRVIGIKEMSNHFTGVALELWPDNNFQQEKAKVAYASLT
jgi:ATP-binding cassette subfamily B protein RaxB